MLDGDCELPNTQDGRVSGQPACSVPTSIFACGIQIHAWHFYILSHLILIEAL